MMTSLLRPLFLFDPASSADWKDVGEEVRQGLIDNSERGITVVAIVVALFAVDFVFRRIARRIQRRVVSEIEKTRPQDVVQAQGRSDTIIATLNWAVGIFLVFLGTGLVLGELGLNVTTLVAGVGVVGIGLGLGAQTLVKDVINGLFILLESQYDVGDVVEAGGKIGVVEEINPRRTVLRDLDGNVHTIPNSAITVATNMTHGVSRVHMDIEVAYESDLDHVIRVINEVCEELSRDRAADVLDPPRVLRVNNFGESGIAIKVLGDVRSFTQWEIMGDLRLRLKKRFDEEGIEIPFPHRTLVQKGDRHAAIDIRLVGDGDGARAALGRAQDPDREP